jgi:Protein of unknown function (DUF664)
VTSLGLVRHMAWVERTWFRERARGEQLARLQTEWRLCDEAVAGLAFEDTFDHHGEAYSLGMTYVHMIAEYARHNDHADLLREAIDGATGR